MKSQKKIPISEKTEQRETEREKWSGALPTIDNFGLIHFHLLFQNKDSLPPIHPFTVASLRSVSVLTCTPPSAPLPGSLHPSAEKNVALQRFNFRTGSLLRLSTGRYLTVSVSIPPRYRSPPPAAAEPHDASPVNMRIFGRKELKRGPESNI